MGIDTLLEALKIDIKDEKIKEIEELSSRVVEDYLELLKPFVQQIDKLNTRVKELEQSNDNWMIQVRLNYSRIKELVEGVRKASHLLESPRIEWATKNAVGILDNLLKEKNS